jgi:hypothetical protein
LFCFPPPPQQQQQQQQDVSILDSWSCTLFLALFDSHFNAVILVVIFVFSFGLSCVASRVALSSFEEVC